MCDKNRPSAAPSSSSSSLSSLASASGLTRVLPYADVAAVANELTPTVIVDGPDAGVVEDATDDGVAEAPSVARRSKPAIEVTGARLTRGFNGPNAGEPVILLRPVLLPLEGVVPLVLKGVTDNWIGCISTILPCHLLVVDSVVPIVGGDGEILLLDFMRPSAVTLDDDMKLPPPTPIEPVVGGVRPNKEPAAALPLPTPTPDDLRGIGIAPDAMDATDGRCCGDCASAFARLEPEVADGVDACTGELLPLFDAEAKAAADADGDVD